MKMVTKTPYEVPRSESIRINSNYILCQSPGGGSDPLNPGGEADGDILDMLSIINGGHL